MWNNLYVFGDSYSDSGAGYVDCDGPTAVVYLARGLGIPFTYATDPDRAGKGLNFAVSGAQTGLDDGTYLSCPDRNVDEQLLSRGMLTQVEDFVSRVKSGEITVDPDKTLFFLAGGLNDSTLTTETTIANLMSAIAQLHAVGACHFRLALLPTRIESFSALSERLNPALRRLPDKIHLAGQDIRLSQWGAFFDEVMEHPDRYGISNTRDACAGRALFDEDPTPHGDPATYYFYHEGHPSTAVHRIVGERLLQELGTAPRKVP